MSETVRPPVEALPTERERFLAAIVDSAEDGIFAKTLDGRILSWNAGAERMYGYTATEIVGDFVFRLAPPDRRFEIETIMDRIRRGERISHYQTVRVRKNGRQFPVSLAISPVRNADGEIVGASTIARDISAEATVAARLRAVVAAIDDCAFVCEPDGRIVLRNRAAIRAFPAVETEGQLLELLNAHAREARHDGAHDPAPESAHELVIGEERRWVRLTRHPVRLGDPLELESRFDVGRVLILRDVTEVQDSQASREAFSGILSHELRTPITTILGAAKVLPRVRGAAARELLDDIAGEADRLYRLVEDLLVLTRIERASLSLADEPVLLGRVIDRVVSGERSALRGQRFDVQIEPNLPIVRGDDTYVEQILRNLVGNAVKYGPAGGLIRIVAEHGARGVLVRVIDEGPGLRAGEAERVFDLLYRSPSTEAQAAGSGVGLFVSRRLAEAMGGRIWAEPRDRPGGEFVVELPPYDAPVDEPDEWPAAHRRRLDEVASGVARS